MKRTPYFIVRTHQDMETVIQASNKPEKSLLCLPPNAPSYMGMGIIWGFLEHLQKNYPAWADRLAVDCGEQAGYVMSALRHGIKICFFKGDPEVLHKLQDMASQKGAVVYQSSSPSARHPHYPR
jgi:hypothetical protein